MLHGFPNLAYSWRKVMPALAAAGYYVVAPDCRGFGRTAGWDDSWDADPQPFLALNLVRDQIALVNALGYHNTAMIVGHDQGSLIAALGALIRPDMFPRLTLIGGASTDRHRSRSIRRTARPRRIPILPTPSSTRSTPS
jgi:pimeloyl-ACP methyl ester carboxylesterase